jgi:hypothetical protein
VVGWAMNSLAGIPMKKISQFFKKKKVGRQRKLRQEFIQICVKVKVHATWVRMLIKCCTWLVPKPHDLESNV